MFVTIMCCYLSVTSKRCFVIVISTRCWVFVTNRCCHLFVTSNCFLIVTIRLCCYKQATLLVFGQTNANACSSILLGLPVDLLLELLHVVHDGR